MISNKGMLLLALFLILFGIGMIVPKIMLPGMLLGALALVAGIFILLGR